MEKLSAWYQARLFIGIGVSEAAALIGLVEAFIQTNLWCYVIGLAFSLLGFFQAAPSRRNIGLVQARLDRDGCGISLGRALMQPSRPDGRGVSDVS